METAIRLDGVYKTYNINKGRARKLKDNLLRWFHPVATETHTVQAAHDIHLAIQKGEAVGIIGPNGAGKTSLLRLIAGISQPNQGRIETHGRILPLLELGAGFHPDLTGLENVYLQGTLFGLSHKDVETQMPRIIEFAELGDYIHNPVRHYSSGMYMRLGFAVSAHLFPDILLIDEAFAVGDLYFTQKCVDRMEEFHQRGGTFLLVSHDNGLIESVCDRVVWMDQGRIVRHGSPREILPEYNRVMFHKSYPAPRPFVHEKQAHLEGRNRFGSGKVVFDYADWRNSKGEMTQRFRRGEALEVRLIYQCREAFPEKIGCQMAAFSERAMPVLCLKTTDAQAIEPDPQGGEIRLRLNRLDLAPGKYSAYISLYSMEDSTYQGILDLHAYLYPFTVYEEEERTSPLSAVAPPLEWSWE